MIGVIPRAEQATVAEEFFELFKTPWEYYEPSRAYDVVVATAGDLPEVDAKLLVVYGAESQNADVQNGIALRSRHRGGSIDYRGAVLPIYGDLATFDDSSKGNPCVATPSGTSVLRTVSAAGVTVIRVGYDLFQEVKLLLSVGQPAKQAYLPTLDIHISMLRSWILSQGIPLLEIPPTPVGHPFIVCLTHDIDFVGIRNHKFDHTMWGFLYRSTVGALRRLCRRRISVKRLFAIWRAAASLPFVFLGWAKDFWEPFEWYLQIEKNLPATYFLIPFKGRAGELVARRHAARRAAAYDVDDLSEVTATLTGKNCELGVHGIDAWHSHEKGRAEWSRIAEVTDGSNIGIRMHWLLCDANTPAVLERAGYAYDSTFGYNETVGYRAGTSQVFRPIGALRLLELPLHIQDGALFYPQRLDLSEPEAEKRCKELMDFAEQLGGVLTILWHDRSHAPERFWGDFYIRLVEVLKSSDVWFATAGQAVGWFRKRRGVRFERLGISNGLRVCSGIENEEALPRMRLRMYHPNMESNDAERSCEETSKFSEVSWDTSTVVEFDSSVQVVSKLPTGLSAIEIC